MVDEPAGGHTHEIDVARHALAAVHEQHERRSRRFRRDDVDRLRLAVLAQRELRRVESAQIMTLGVLHRRFQSDAGYAALLDDLERGEIDLVAYNAADWIVDLDGQFAGFERIFVF